ncbi:Integrase core domain family protein [Candida albicans]|uniref:Integrase core domain family protein n=1 Tax=Candida albicans TaxID=5476 RepID=A0A8H6C066_CANAX|nr:Integrase core domain family protein [Candida albicans]
MGRLTKLDQPIMATTATNKRHQITHSVDFTITKPFKLQFQAYVLPGLRKIILGRPTLQQLRYELTPTSEFITIAGQKYNCTLERFVNNLTLSVSKVTTLTHESLIEDIKKKYPQLADQTTRKPKNRQFKYDIVLTSDQPVISKPYFCNAQDKEVIELFLQQNLDAGILSHAPDNIPISLSAVFVVRTANKARVVVDFRRLNAVTKKIPYYVPNLRDLAPLVHKAKCFSTIDLKAAYHQIGVTPRTSHAFGIVTHLGNYVYQTLPFGATNSPYVFCNFINDVLIYADNLEDNARIVNQVCEALNNAGLQINIDKTKLLQKSVKFLGFIISEEGTKVDPDKIASISHWQLPSTKSEVRSLISFVSFIRSYIPRGSSRKGPITHNDESIKAFNELKSCLTTISPLGHYNPHKVTHIFTDASTLAVGAVICQSHNHKGSTILAPISFFSAKLTPTQSRYSTMERELLAIVATIVKNRHLTGGPLYIYTDHFSLSRFLDVLTAYQPRIFYLAGKSNILADFCSRYQTDSMTEDQLSDPDSLTTNSSDFPDSTTAHNDDLPLHHFTVINDELKVILQNQVLPVFSRANFTNLVQSIHSHYHASIRITHYFALQMAWHPDSLPITINTIRHCSICQQTAPITSARREIIPLEPVPAFTRWAFDYVGPLQGSPNASYILVGVEYTTGLLYAVPTLNQTSATVVSLLQLISQVHSYPNEVICDNGRQFIANDVQSWCQHHFVKLIHTSNYHPISNGRVERANGLIKKILRGLIGPSLPNWDSVLYKAVQIYNGTPTIHGHTPYFLAMGISTHSSNYRDQLVQAFPPSPTEAEFNEEVAMLRLHELVVKGKSVDKHNDAKTQKMAYQKMMSAPFGIPANFQKGQWIYRRRKKSAKNQYNFDGPFLIEEVRNNNSYIISRNGKREKGTYHQDMLKPAFALEDSPITALSNFQKSMQEIEYRVLGKMFDEIKVRVIMLSDIMKNRKPVKIDAVMTHPQFYERERVML